MRLCEGISTTFFSWEKKEKEKKNIPQTIRRIKCTHVEISVKLGITHNVPS